jgi:signal transduction histidine kinase
VAYSSEDSMIHNILRSVNQETIPLNSQVKEISLDELINMGYEHFNKDQLSKRVGGFGEFPNGEKYYHFMILEDKVILFESTNFVINDTRLKGVIKLLLQAFIPFLIAAFFISKIIAKRALKPFSTLKTTLLKPDKLAIDIREVNQHIKETDVKQIADELVFALEKKEQILAQQIAFNQGMSHELRTPLQVMTHAVELIGIKNPELMQQDVYMRLANSMSRMHRTSEAMLWLTSTNESTHQTQVNTCLARIKNDILQTYNNHGLKLDIQEQGKLSLPMPEEVFEFILYNLVNNVVHHGKVDNETIPLYINITADSICFKNAVVSNEVKNANSTTNFGLGLSLVSKLCKRFGLRESIENNKNVYSIEINLS